MRKQLASIQDSHADYTLRQIQAEFLSPTQVKLSLSTIDKVLIRIGFTTKMLKVQPEERNSKEAIAGRIPFAVKALDFDIREVIYVDEFGINLHSHRSRGRSRRGNTAVIKQKGSRRKILLLLQRFHLSTVCCTIQFIWEERMEHDSKSFCLSW